MNRALNHWRGRGGRRAFAEGRKREATLRNRRPIWRNWAFLAGLAVIPLLMVTVDGPISSMMRSIDGGAKAVIDMLAQAGDSKYSLVPTAVATIALMLLYFADANTVHARVFAWLAAAVGFVFASIAYSGILVNIVKVLVGRTRPHIVDVLDWPDFHPIALTGSYHSFPSGHANTVFAIALAVGFLVPRVRNFLLVLAAGLAFCRVLQFRHFVSDSLGGALLAVATTLWLRDLFARGGIVFVLRKDGRTTLAAPGRLLVRWIKRGFGLKRRPAGEAMAHQIAGQGD